ncbi:hypothetical protein N7512_005782 [Penicillium capsulatum]|nr:hypothetical protein N7512_005782 [Penicillium capsulatum]
MSDDWIHSAKQSSYHGRAKVMLGHFDLSDTSGTRTTREEHINSLVRVFESEGCMRSSPDNYVKVIVERNLLQQFLTGQGLSEAHLHGELQFLDFPSDFRLTLLHGKHRLLAAERFLWDKWWVAEFYSEDLPQDVRQFIHEEHPNAQRFSDGDIYQNIRTSQTQGNVDAEIKWRGRLPGRVKKILDRLEKDFKRIQRGMDNLLPFKGLWNSLKLSYLGRWLSIKCPEARRTIN